MELIEWLFLFFSSIDVCSKYYEKLQIDLRIAGSSVLTSGRVYQFAILVQVGFTVWDVNVVYDQSVLREFELLALIKDQYIN